MFEEPFGSKVRRKKSINQLGDNLDLVFSSKPKKKRDSRRSFTRTQKAEIWDQQNGKCAKCLKILKQRTVEYDHGKAWSDGGRTVVKNGRAMCAECHKLKTHKERLKKVNKKRKESKSSNFITGEDIIGKPPKLQF
jgi:hypothetical protein